MPDKVFLSCANQDKSTLNRLRDFLRTLKVIAGSEIFLPDYENFFTIGANIRQKLQETIRESDKVVVILTETSVDSPFLNYEIGLAEALGKPIIVVVPTEFLAEIQDRTPKLSATARGSSKTSGYNKVIITGLPRQAKAHLWSRLKAAFAVLATRHVLRQDTKSLEEARKEFEMVNARIDHLLDSRRPTLDGQLAKIFRTIDNLTVERGGVPEIQEEPRPVSRT